MNYIRSLSEHLPEEDYGSKAGGLSRMKSLGLAVPDGYAISHSARTEQVLNKGIGNELRGEISESLQDLSTEKIIVRSSGIGEDGIDYSYAGQLDSFVVDRHIDAVVEAVMKCWASLESERVKTYAKLSGGILDKMGVVIQEFLDAEYSGVLFTETPAEGTGMYCEYVKGAAEALVAGKITPEHFTADPSGKIQGKNNVPFDHLLLADQAAKLREKLNRELDIEWIWKEGTLYFVQARPITVRKAERKAWTNSNLNENYPDPMSPLLFSIASESYYHYFRNLSLRLRIRRASLETLETDFRNVVGSFGNRIYYNMTSIHNIIAASPFHTYFQKAFNQFVGYSSDAQSNRVFRQKAPLVTSGINLFFLNVRLGSHVRKIEKKVESFVRRAGEAKDRSSYLASFDEFLDLRFRQWFHAGLADFFSMLHYRLLGGFTARYFGKEATGIHNILIQAIKGLISNGPLFASWDILQEIEKVEGGIATFSDTKAEEILELIEQDAKWANVSGLIDQYLEKWGFRCSGELMFLKENYIESPDKFIELLQAYICCGNNDPSIVLEKKRKERRRFVRNLVARIFRKRHILFPVAIVEVLILGALTILCRQALRSRERVRYQQARMYYHFKVICFELGKELVSHGLLIDHKDILFMEFREIREVISSKGSDIQNLQQVIRNRQIEFGERSKENWPDSFETIGGSIVKEEEEDISVIKEEYTGLAASGGRIRGRVKVLESVLEAQKIKNGEILVTRQTDPGWAMVFPIIGGIVVENGGALSHGAIVAREFGIPAVVGVKGITRFLKDNDEIILDGDHGTIRLI